MKRRGVRVDQIDDKYRILLMGLFSQGEPSRELVMCKEDFYSILDQGNKLREAEDGTTV
jgi:hypothetical protein